MWAEAPQPVLLRPHCTGVCTALHLTVTLRRAHEIRSWGQGCGTSPLGTACGLLCTGVLVTPRAPAVPTSLGPPGYFPILESWGPGFLPALLGGRKGILVFSALWQVRN